MNRRSRAGWADLAKGICIILVILWHVITKHAHFVDWGPAQGLASLWAVSSAQLLPLRMPLFFLISGVFAAGAVFSADWSRTRRRMALLFSLYALWLTIQTFALWAIAPDFDTARAHNVLEYLAELTISPTNLWYLLALGWYLAIARATRNAPAPLVLGAAFAAAAVAGTGILPDGLGNLWQVIQNLVFFLVGVRLRDLVTRVAGSVGVWKALAAGAAFAVGLGAVGYLDARAWFGVWTLLCLAAVYAGLSWCVLFDRWLPRASSPLLRIGRNTLPIYVLHMLPLAAIDRVVRGTGIEDALANHPTALGYPVVLTALVIAICTLLHPLLDRIGRGFLFNPLVVLPAKAEPAAPKSIDATLQLPRQFGNPPAPSPLRSYGQPMSDATVLLTRRPRGLVKQTPETVRPPVDDRTLLLPRQPRTPPRDDPPPAVGNE
ncbi:acyltransferase family protein [Glycomyces luteolus]|uniref:Acyltransferase family protein n=1 Tax=Glycomyces luteolus TaxID=2670330 RepID=A0A9X3P4X3_9ACTN|nr:acyltransferase family protein [Glycomyces luteolus]MDA1358372.1 acyltransferase family protein [Glycomyces luteolus]